MNRTCLAVLAAALVVGISLVGEANPIMCEVLHLRQTPLTEHVQITFADDCEQSFEIVSVERDGEALSLEWSPFEGYRTNTGSGIRELKSDQTCDCDVFLGEHEYVVRVRRGGVAPDVADLDFTYPIVVKRAEDVAAPVPVEEDTDTYEYGWDIPEPVEVQGLDCEAQCRGGTDEVPTDTDSGGKDTEVVADAGPDEDVVETDVEDEGDDGATDDGDEEDELDTEIGDADEDVDMIEDGDPDDDAVEDNIDDEGVEDGDEDVVSDEDGDEDGTGDGDEEVGDDGDGEAVDDGEDGDDGTANDGDEGDGKPADAKSPAGEASGCSTPGRIGASSHPALLALFGLTALFAFTWRSRRRP